MKKTDELRQMDEKALRAELSDLKKGLFKTSFEVKSGQSKNIHEIRRQKRQIARIETVLNQITKDNEN